MPQPNRNCDAAGKSNANGNDHTTSIANGHGNSNSDGNNHTTSTFTDTDANADAASPDSKAPANAVSTADAVSEWVKKLNELQSNRELARQLASSLLCRVLTQHTSGGVFQTDQVLIEIARCALGVR